MATFRVGDGVIFEMILETTEHKLNSARLYIGIYDSQERYIFPSKIACPNHYQSH
jgi:hypothetical protein